MSDSPVSIQLDDGTAIEGRCEPGFEPVRDAFAANFTSGAELGAGVCITVGGKVVADLWGGLADKAAGRSWQEDTLVVVFSCTKGATALCAHMLASRGLLDLDAPVTEYWPDYGQAGKENTTVTMLLDHSAGVPVPRETVKKDGYYDWDYMCGLLEAQAPFWESGTRLGYHGTTFGWLVGELVRRISGKSLGTFFREEIADPLGLDFWIGLPEEHEPRVAPVVRNKPNVKDAQSLFLRTILNERGSISNLFAVNTGSANAKDRAYRAAELGSTSGVTNARGLAGLYAPLANGGALNGVSLVDTETLARMGRTAMATHMDATLMMPTRFALGFIKSIDNRALPPSLTGESVIIGESAFGHVGMGGSVGFADPEAGMSFGYVMNNMGPGVLVNQRGQALIDAAYRCLGYTSNASGAWLKD